MKYIVFGVICIFSLTRALPNHFNQKAVHTALSNVNFSILPVELVEKLAQQFDSDEEPSLGIISTIVNEYADLLFSNLQRYINDHNLNDMELPDATLKIVSGHIDLSNGHLEDLNTIGRREDVVVAYSADEKKITISLPIKFDDLKFFYDYYTKVLFIKIHGGVHGSVTDIKVNADLSFDFTTYTTFLDHYDMKDSGKVHVKFTGNAVVDWLSNAMTDVIAVFLGQVIVNVIAKFIRENLRALMDMINEAINRIIHP